jgi:hypothetical protein
MASALKPRWWKLMSSRARIAPVTAISSALFLLWGGVIPAAGAPIPVAEVEPYSGSATGDRLAVIGDSITEMSHDAIHRQLDGAYYVSVDGRPGFTISEQLPVAAVYSQQHPAPDVIVVNLGTNDAMLGTTLGDATNDLADVTANFPRARCVVLTTVNANTMGVTFNDWANAFNFWTIFGMAGADARVRIADWNTSVHAYYEAGQPQGDLTYDLVHPTPLGQERLSTLVADTVASCPT